MPKRDDAIDLDQLPTMNAHGGVADDPKASTADVDAAVRAEVSRQQKVDAQQQRKAAKIQKTLVAGLVLLLLACGVLAGAAYQFQQSLVASNARIAALELRLSNTDESMSQSSVAMQVKFNELKEKTDELWGQMDKLWASAWRRNQTEIADHGQQLETQEKSLASVQTLIQDIEKVNTQLKKEMIDLQKRAKQLDSQNSSTAKSLAAHKETVQDINSTLASLKKGLAATDARSIDNSQWIESINAFRKQTNKTLSQLERDLKSLNPKSLSKKPST